MSMKKDATITTEVDVAGRTITFQVAGARERALVLDVERVSAKVFEYAAYDRLRNRVIDAAALPFNSESNSYATPQEKYDAMAALVEWLESGTDQWTRRVQRDASATDGSLLLRALCKLRTDRSLEQIKTFLAGLDKAEKAKLLNSKQVRPIADAIRLEGAQSVDGDALLRSL